MRKQTRTELIGAAEVAALFDRDIRTVGRWTREGRLPVAKKLPGKTGAYLYDAATISKLAKEAGTRTVIAAPKAIGSLIVAASDWRDQ